MSIFRTEAFVLSLQHIRDKTTRCILFTEDFGKITVWSKDQTIDIGMYAEVLIERKQSTNQLLKFTAKYTFDRKDWTYLLTYEYMHIFKVLKDVLPEGGDHRGLFRSLKNHLHMEKIDVRNVGFFLHIQYKILKSVGFMHTLDFPSFEIFPLSPRTSYSEKDIQNLIKATEQAQNNYIQKS